MAGEMPELSGWNSFLEQVVTETKASTHQIKNTTPPKELSQLAFEAFKRFPVPISEFNRVTGRRDCSRFADLIGGEPGIGKSTLLLQASALIAKSTGEWSMFQGKKPQSN